MSDRCTRGKTGLPSRRPCPIAKAVLRTSTVFNMRHDAIVVILLERGWFFFMTWGSCCLLSISFATEAARIEEGGSNEASFAWRPQINIAAPRKTGNTLNTRLVVTGAVSISPPRAIRSLVDHKHRTRNCRPFKCPLGKLCVRFRPEGWRMSDYRHPPVAHLRLEAGSSR